jgi:nicotinamidase/pyrazinamidase
MHTQLRRGDALLIVNVQNDFCPGGALAVPNGDIIIPMLNRWISMAEAAGIPVFASRDWHPEGHISFQERGGPWPRHCVQDQHGAEFHPALQLPYSAHIISKATEADSDSYSTFGRTDLAGQLRKASVHSLWIGGLALDYCVKESALDAIRLGFEVHLLADATRAVNLHPEDAAIAFKEMREAGVIIER